MPKAGEAILNLFSKLGGNMNNVLGSRSNITFLGKGKNPEGFIDSDINVEAIGFLGKNKILEELESSIGYLTAGKLNDVQANKLLENMQKVDDVFNPKQVANITDLATGTRNLDAEGLGALRSKVDDIDLPEGVAAEDVGSQVATRNKEGIISFGDSDEIATPFQSAEETFRKLRAQGQDELALKLEAAMMKGPLANVGNQGGTPAKRATAREFLVEALKKENPNQTSLSDIIDEVDVKYITEGGGGIGGDPLLLVEKYFGPRIRELVPEGASSEEIAIFTQRVLNNVIDAAGNKPSSPDFDRLTARILDIDIPGGPKQPFADGGRVGLRFGGDTMGGPNDKSENTESTKGADEGGQERFSVGSGYYGETPTTSNTGGNNNQTKFSPIGVRIGSDYTPLGPVPRFADLDLATKYGILNLRTDLLNTLKDKELDSTLSYSGSVGPVNINTSTDLEGNKFLGADFNKGNFGVSAFTDFDGNKGVQFGYRKALGQRNRNAKGGLAKILEV